MYQLCTITKTEKDSEKQISLKDTIVGDFNFKYCKSSLKENFKFMQQPSIHPPMTVEIFYSYIEQIIANTLQSKLKKKKNHPFIHIRLYKSFCFSMINKVHYIAEQKEWWTVTS